MSGLVRVVVRKEFREYRRNKLIILTMAMLPVFFLTFPLVAVLLLPAHTGRETVEAVVGQAFLVFLLVPVILPTTIAAYSVIGEREQATLEPVLTTPIEDEQLLRGKALAATAPAVLLAWVLYGVFVGVAALWGEQVVRDEVLRLDQLVAQLALTPVLAVFAIEVGMAISARSTDIRVAQQLSGLAMLPVFAAIALFSFGVIATSEGRYLAAAGVLALVDVAAWRAVTRMFDRERVLTRAGPG